MKAMQDADCHVLVDSRDSETISLFLNTFLPQRECSVTVWLVEQGTEQEITDSGELIEFCIRNPNETRSIYWRGLNDYARRSAWVFFTDDGATIYGLTCFNEDEAQADQLLEQLKNHFGSKVGYISYVEPPPHSASQYIFIFQSI